MMSTFLVWGMLVLVTDEKTGRRTDLGRNEELLLWPC